MNLLDDEHKLNFLDNCFDDDFCTGEHFAVLRALAYDADPYVRSQVACAAVNFINPGTKELLLQLTRDEDPLVRAEAYDSLSLFPYDDVEKCLLDAIEEEWDPIARSYAIFSWADITVALCRNGNDAAVWIRQRLPREKSEHCRLAFCYALHGFGDGAALSDLMAFLRSRDYHIRCAAVSTLAELMDENDRADVERAVKDLLTRETTKSVKATVARCFPQLI